MGEAQVSLEHLFRVFTKPEHKDSKMAQIEQHLSEWYHDRYQKSFHFVLHMPPIKLRHFVVVI